MTEVSITEFRNNIKKYSELCKTEDIIVSNHGEKIFIVKSARNSKMDALNNIVGAVETDIDFDKILEMKVNEL